MSSHELDLVLKKGILCKRSIYKRKNKFGTQNYKSRLFELTGHHLHYYDGDLQNKGKLKGSIPLATIKVVMEVDDNKLENRSNVFQVVYSDRQDYPTLYVIAESQRLREEWVNVTRNAAIEVGAQFFPRYHHGVWTKKLGYYNCCDQCDRNAVGCKYDAKITKSPPVPVPPPRLDNAATPSKIVIAIYDYEPTEDKDLELVEGETYTIINDSADNWWMAENADGKQGYIPANYVKVNCGLGVYEWYYQSCSREASGQMLSASSKEGCFLVRDSVSRPGEYTLSICTGGDGKVRHYNILLNELNQYYIAKNHIFSSIPELINYHKHNAGGIHTRLREPPPRGNKPSTAGFGYGGWQLNPKYLTMGAFLGKGAFGEVKQGKYKKGMTEWDVAVKQIKFNSASDEFIMEFKTMTQLSHPNIVQLHGVIVKNETQQIVTELLIHGALNNYLQKNEHKLKGDQNKLIDYCAQVACGMDYLDKKQIIHRDLAARNCLVGPNEIIKVADFGLARMVLSDDEYQMSDGSKFPFKWAPPEVLHHRLFSSKSDVWAYGILMWEIYSFGEMPYSGKNNAQVAKFVADEKKRLDCPRAAPMLIYQLMKECWNEEPLYRPNFGAIKFRLSGLTSKGDYMAT